MPEPCPCQRGLPFAQCCGPYLTGTVTAPTAERLMRSRYTAFALQDSRYLLDTWDPSTRPPAIELDPGTRWVQLVVVGSTGGGLLDSRGTVEFRADYRVGGQSRSLRENCLFLRQDKRWYYVGTA